MRSFTFAAAATAVCGTILIFTACSGVPDITFAPDGTGTDGSSSSNSGSSGNTSSSGTPTDGPRDVVSDCKATGPEICDDGIDNDCNGKTDCADDACKPGNECVDPAPPGWTLVSFADSPTQPACGAGYETPTDLKVVDGTGGGNCACNCNPTSGSACTAGAFAVHVDTSACSSNAVNIAPNTNCTQLANNITVPGGTPVGNATPPAGPSACGATVVAPGGPTRAARTCNVASTTKFGKGCTTATQLCAPKTTGFEACITKLGNDACPAPYTDRKTAGSAAVDTRACGACTCEPKGCTGSVEIFSEADCTIGGNKKTSGTIDTSCTALTDKAFTATHYKTMLADPQNGCGINGTGFNPALTGDIQWTDQRTVCCKP